MPSWSRLYICSIVFFWTLVRSPSPVYRILLLRHRPRHIRVLCVVSSPRDFGMKGVLVLAGQDRGKLVYLVHVSACRAVWFLTERLFPCCLRREWLRPSTPSKITVIFGSSVRPTPSLQVASRSPRLTTSQAILEILPILTPQALSRLSPGRPINTELHRSFPSDGINLPQVSKAPILPLLRLSHHRSSR